MTPITRILLLFPLLGAITSVGAQSETSGSRELRLGAGSFDPVIEGEPAGSRSWVAVPPLRPEQEDRYRLVQFTDKITAEVLRGLERRGLEVVDYVPSGALIVRLPVSGTAAALGGLAGLRWSGPLEPGYKIESELLEGLSEGVLLERPSFDVGLFAGEDPGPVAAALEERFSSVRIEFVKTGEPVRITFDVSPNEAPEAIRALAQDPAVALIAQHPRLVPHNDNAVWVGQSFDTISGPAEAVEPDPKPYGLSATIWSRGLHGEGQVLAVADTGLEHELCYFADPAHPVVAQHVSAPNPVAVNPAHRKILAVNAPASGLLFDDWFRHGTHVTATAVADDLAHLAGGGSAGHDHGDGMAPAAKLVFEDISGAQSSSCSTSMSVPSLQDLLTQEHGAGARVSSNSWGSSLGLTRPAVASTGRYDFVSFEVDAGVFSLEELLVVVSAGNRGPAAFSLTGLARCKNCLSVGATEAWNPTSPDPVGPVHPDNMTTYSSQGPTSDGRTKPDITAPGLLDSVRFPVTYHANTQDAACNANDPDICFPSFGGCYDVDDSATCNTTQVLSGTSQATPIVSGLALLARQYFTEGFHPSGGATPADALEPSAALLKAVLINGARNMTGHLLNRPSTDLGPLADAPSNVQGWGRVMLDDVLYFPGESRRLRLFDLRHANGIATDHRVEQTFDVTSSAEPLKLTLAWSDTPGTAIALGALVNDLDLKLTAPDGRVYRGNQWTTDNINIVGDKQSRPNPAGRDAVNNVEGILLKTPAAGLYKVEVSGFQVPGGGGLETQGAALVVTGAVADCTDEPPPSLTTSAAASGQVVLSWAPVPGAVGYEVLRNQTGCGVPMPADVVSAVPSASSSFGDSAVAASSTYHYAVRARMSAGGCFTGTSDCVSVTTPAPGPPPVPDGTFGSPMRVAPLNESVTQLTLTWDASSCTATDYHVLYGSLDDVGDLEPVGAVCDLGPSGVASWLNVPPGDLWFLVVSDDGVTTEGSWGVDSSGLPRRPGVASGACSLVVRNDFAVCD